MKPNKTTLVYNQIKEEIQNGSYSPNERLVETELAATFSTSRNTIRTALSLLEKENLIVIEPNKGAKVASFQAKDIHDLMDLRAVIEAYIVKSAVTSLEEKDIQQLEKIFQNMESGIHNENFQNHSQLNNEFHQIIYDHCENKRAVSLVEDLKNQIGKYNVRAILMPGRKESTLDEHKSILEAVKNRDEEAAAAAIIHHIDSVRESIIRYLEFEL